jgi:nucleoside-diphosphate-sugar epimerase
MDVLRDAVALRVLVLGGTGFIGPHVVTSLHGRGHNVAVFHRGRTEAVLPAGVRRIHCRSAAFGERAKLAEFRQEFQDFAPDVVVDMIPATQDDARAVMDTFRSLAARVVAISSQDVYRAYGVLTGIEPGPPEPVPVAEDAPLRERLFPYRADPPRDPEDPRHWLDDYEKILVERAVLGEPDLPGTILRLPMVYGPKDRQHRMFEYLRRMEDKRPAILLAEGLAQWRWTRGYVEDVAAAVVLAVVDERAARRTYNVGEPEALSMAEWIRQIGLAINWQGEIISVANDLLPEALREEMNTSQDLVSSSDRIRQELGYAEIVARETAIARTAAWERANPPEESRRAELDYAAEDAVLKRLGRFRD